MIRRTWFARLFVVAAATGVAVAMTTGSAQAGLLPVSVTVQPDAGNFRWTYSVILPTGMRLESGSYFTIYDFAGYKDGSGMVSAALPDPSFSQYWKVSTAPVGPTPDLINPLDDPNIDNLTFTYTNGPVIPAGELTLGSFVAISEYGQARESYFTATNPRVSDGQIDSNVTTTQAPLRRDLPPPTSSPEPTTLVLAGLGLPLVGLGRYLRRKGQPVAV